MNFDSSKTVTANAVEALEKYILEKELKPGDSLPTESEFAEHFNVSRGIIREALQYFRTLGIIESRPRKGMTIKSFLPQNPFGPYLPFCRHKEDRAAVCELRAIIDTGMAGVLIAKANSKSIAKLKAIALNMGKADLFEIRKLDLEFHRYLMKIAQNSFLSCLEPFIIDYFESVNTFDEVYYRDPDAYREDAKSKHMDIVESITNKDENKLRKLLKSHYCNY